jgi:hypothetical protein
MTTPDKNAELEAQASRILAEMDALRSRYLQAAKSDRQPNVELLQQMEATSRRYREVNERLS